MKRLLGHVDRARCFCVPEVKLIRQVQIVLFFQATDVLYYGPCSGKISIANGLLHLQQIGVRPYLRRQLGRCDGEEPEQDYNENASDCCQHDVSPFIIRHISPAPNADDAPFPTLRNLAFIALAPLITAITVRRI